MQTKRHHQHGVAARKPMYGMRRLIVLLVGSATLIPFLLFSLGVFLRLRYEFPYRIEPDGSFSGLIETPGGVAIYVVSICALIAICQLAVFWWLLRDNLHLLRGATEFVDMLPYRHGGQLEVPHTRVRELAELVSALNATSLRLSIQDEALATLEVRLKGVIDALPDQVFFKSAIGTYLVCNRAFADQMARPELEIVGYAESEFADEASAAAHEAVEARIMQDGEVHVAREWQAGCDGYPRLIETTRCVLRANTGEALGILGIGRDITEAVRREQAEKAHARIFHLLADAAALPEVLAQVAAYVDSQFPLLHCAVMTSNERKDVLSIVAAPGLPSSFLSQQQRIPDDAAACCYGVAIQQARRVYVDDMSSDACWADMRTLLQECGINRCWLEPIISARNEMLGLIALLLPSNSGMADERALFATLEEAANLASVAIERCHAASQLQLAAKVYNASSEGIFVMNADNTVIAVNPAFTQITGYTAEDVLYRPSMLLDSERGSTDLPVQIEAALATRGQWEGEIWNRRKSGELFAGYLTLTTAASDGTVHRVGLFADITERKRSEEIIWFQANNDALTGLPNRRLFRDRLEQDIVRAQRAGQRVALLFIDLDNFKQVNDALGHEAGDLLLVEAARRIRACVRGADTVARLGGDEFTVTLPNFGSIATVERICKSILARLTEPFRLNGENAYISASVGITQYPDDAQDIESLLKNADQSMYAAKRQGRNNFSWFTAELREAAREWHALANDLRTALGEDQFEVYFQPIIDLHTQMPVKAEALLRWKHPQRGMVSPALFIPVAEEIGIIGEIGNWVFREAIRHAAAWPLVGGQAVAVSINKSPRQFVQADVDEDWIAHLHSSGFDPSRLIVEITEGLLLEEKVDVGAQLAALRDAGAKIAIDDFGTGYSSLSYLKKFPINFIKIDKSFVRDVSTDINDRALCEAIIAIANLLGMQVVAEGVETEEQRTFLYNAGGDFGQGYLFAKPMPATEFIRFLAQPRLVNRQAA